MITGRKPVTHRDLELLQGDWTVAALEMDGERMSLAMLADARVTIAGKQFTTTGMGAEYRGTIELDSAASPRQIDMKFTAGPEKGNTNLGIYEVNGDTWRLCLATRGKIRPTSFVSPPGSGIAVETLTRGGVSEAAKKTPRASRKVSAPATEFEGEWSMVSGVMDGVAMEPSIVHWVKRITHGNETTVKAGPQTMLKVEFTSDPTKSPKTIDYRNLYGTHKGKPQQGIYQFENDLLTVCIAPVGADRPASFQSVRGDGRTLTVWKRG